MELSSGIIITERYDEALRFLEKLRDGELFTIVKSLDGKGNPKEFLLEHAREAIEKAYISTDKLNYIILVSPKFSEVAQNRLLKILEEPPRNKRFIIITKSKSAILDTIKSRMAILNIPKDYKEKRNTIALDIENLTLATVYDFIQENNRLSSHECRLLVEQISTSMMKSNRYDFDKETLILFSNLIEALNVGSSTTFVLNTLFLELLDKKRS